MVSTANTSTHHPPVSNSNFSFIRLILKRGFKIALGTSDQICKLNTDRAIVPHNLKYFTWVEQQGKTYEEILDQWYDPDYWIELQAQIPEMDALIDEFNARTGLLK